MIRVYLGVDFHATKIVTHRIERRSDGTVRRTNGSFFPEDLLAFTRTLDQDTYVCVEASTGVFEFCDVIRSYVKDVIVIHPNEFRRMYLSGKKTDSVDAKKLADRLKVHIEDGDAQDDFPSVWIPPATIRELRELFSCLQLLKTQINMQKNKLRSILRLHLNVHARDVDVVTLNIDELELPCSTRLELHLIQGLLCSALLAKKQLEDRVRRVAIEYDEATVKLFVTLHGISIMGASALLADAGCIERFKSAKKFSRYLRSAPRVDSSNDTTRIGHIDKAGRKTTFGYLIEGLNNIYAGNPNYTRFYEKKCASKSKGKVRAAIVRKTLTTIYYMWRNREEYRFTHDSSTSRKIKEIERIKNSSQVA